MNWIVQLKNRLKPKLGIGGLIDRYLHKFLMGSTTIEQLVEPAQLNIEIQPAEISTPEIMEMNILPKAKSIQQDTYSVPAAYSTVLDNVLYSPIYNVLATRSRQIILDSINTKRSVRRFSVSNLYRRPTKKIAGVCSIFRTPSASYYHTLVESVPRLYLLDREEYKTIDTIQLLFPSPPNPVEAYYLEKMLPVNATVKVVDEDYLYLTDRLIFPSFLTRRFAGYLPSQYLQYFQEKVLPNRPRNKKNRILISRSPDRRQVLEKVSGVGRYEREHLGQGRYILNEEELFDGLKDYGFKQYTLESLSIPEQIELFYDAEYVIGAHGAGLTNILCCDRISILELFPSKFTLPHYYYLAKSLGHTHSYWCGNEENFHAPFTVNVAEIIEGVRVLG